MNNRLSFAIITAVALITVMLGVGAISLAPSAPAQQPPGEALDSTLRLMLADHGITPLDPGPTPDPAKVELGKALYFDKLLSGNRDISCATCHLPLHGTGDGLPLSIGTGGFGEAPDRMRGAMRMLIARNAPDVFNRGSPEWHSMFWDGRVVGNYNDGFTHPHEFTQALPTGLDSVLAAQAMFPVTARAEMRGDPKDVDVFGQVNELAATGEKDLVTVWQRLTDRLQAVPEYRELFAQAYPDVPANEFGFQHAANAIAAFEIDAFTLLDSPWDRFLAGDDSALSTDAQHGALLFYGDAGCARCHSGNLLTDQEFHNAAVPQLGPGKGRQNPYIDLGRARETGNPDDRFAFRTPPLRNVALTGPWMHNGAFATLEDAVRHMADPLQSFASFDYDLSPVEVQAETRRNPAIDAEIAQRLDPLFAAPVELSDGEVAQILAFLDALTDPRAATLEEIVPASVPSGLPVGDNAQQSTAFAHVSDQAGITARHTEGYQVTGQAWADVDGDGWLDLYVTNSIGPNTLYHNNGDGTFSVSPLNQQVALPDHYSGGASFADYDNDGWPDLLVLGRENDVLLHNNQGGGFSDVTAAAGVSDSFASKTASWADYDNDGWLDLYVANWGCVPRCARTAGVSGEPDRLYHNNGDGTFSDVTDLLDGQTYGGGFVARWLDFDNDGDQDIYLVNDEFILPPGNKLFRNDGPGCAGGWCFTEVSAEQGADTRVMGMGIAADDWNGDGWLDLFFTNAGRAVMLQKQGSGPFENVAAEAGVAMDARTVAWGATSLDYDNDGLRDLYVATMRDGVSAFNPLFRNQGDGTFADIGRASGADDPGPSVGVAAADYDNDGWVDLVVGNYDRGYHLFHNQAAELSGNNWLALKLVGGGPVNRDAVGTRVTVTASDGRVQMQDVHNGSSVGSGESLTLNFGLGESHPQTVTVDWPDGTQQTFFRLSSDRAYEITYNGGVRPTSPGGGFMQNILDRLGF